MTRHIIARVIAAVLLVLTLPTAHALAQDGGSVVYRVERGDTLYGIAKRYLRGQSAAIEVQRLNRVRNPRRMPVNKQLRVPRRLLRFDLVELKVSAFSGPVTIGGNAPSVGLTLREGQVIRTGTNGFVTFRANFGGRISMPSNSSARLITARRYVMNDILDVDFSVDRGRGEAGSPTLRSQDRLRMRTPVGTTAVRGTDFRVAYDDAAERGTTEVIEGKVAVAAGEEEKAIPEGFGVASLASGVGEQEALLPATELVKPGAVQTDARLGFTLIPQSAAKAYRVQLARDAGFLDVITETVTPGVEVSFDPIDDGRYFVRGRAISATGIEGKSQAYSFRRKRLGVTGSTSQSPLLDGFLFEWLAQGEGQSTYAFQLWDEAQPTELLVDETGLDKSSLVLTNLKPATYQWRVAVMQAEEEGLLKVWSDPSSLIVSE